MCILSVSSSHSICTEYCCPQYAVFFFISTYSIPCQKLLHFFQGKTNALLNDASPVLPGFCFVHFTSQYTACFSAIVLMQNMPKQAILVFFPRQQGLTFAVLFATDLLISDFVLPRNVQYLSLILVMCSF